jgi:hypothetical protein
MTTMTAEEWIKLTGHEKWLAYLDARSAPVAEAGAREGARHPMALTCPKCGGSVRQVGRPWVDPTTCLPCVTIICDACNPAPSPPKDEARCGKVLKGDMGEEYVCALNPAHVTADSDHCDEMGLYQWPCAAPRPVASAALCPRCGKEHTTTTCLMLDAPRPVEADEVKAHNSACEMSAALRVRLDSALADVARLTEALKVAEAALIAATHYTTAPNELQAMRGALRRVQAAIQPAPADKEE